MIKSLSLFFLLNSRRHPPRVNISFHYHGPVNNFYGHFLVLLLFCLNYVLDGAIKRLLNFKGHLERGLLCIGLPLLNNLKLVGCLLSQRRKQLISLLFCGERNFEEHPYAFNWQAGLQVVNYGQGLSLGWFLKGHFHIDFLHGFEDN